MSQCGEGETPTGPDPERNGCGTEQTRPEVALPPVSSCGNADPPLLRELMMLILIVILKS